MVQSETLQISLSGDAAARVREALESGKYASAADVVNDALRDWEPVHEVESISELRALWDEAVNDERPSVDPEEVNARLRAKFPLITDKSTKQ